MRTVIGSSSSVSLHFMAMVSSDEVEPSGLHCNSCTICSPSSTAVVVSMGLAVVVEMLSISNIASVGVKSISAPVEGAVCSVT